MKTKIFCIVIAVLSFVCGYYACRACDIRTQAKEVVTIEESGLTDWQIMELAIYKTESDFNTLAIGKTEDWGLAQITPIYVKEVNRILGEERYIHEDAFNPEKTHEMMRIMQDHHNPSHDIDRAISSHNPLALSEYSVKVRRNMESIRKYEHLRDIVRK